MPNSSLLYDLFSSCFLFFLRVKSSLTPPLTMRIYTSQFLVARYKYHTHTRPLEKFSLSPLFVAFSGKIVLEWWCKVAITIRTFWEVYISVTLKGVWWMGRNQNVSPGAFPRFNSLSKDLDGFVSSITLQEWCHWLQIERLLFFFLTLSTTRLGWSRRRTVYWSAFLPWLQ